ncbi:MAG: family 10 glycosylhydrolase [Muribaculaceae bacterium]|nr:family 10 glycosylhydrolase [Muribaculaceae bacterium]
MATAIVATMIASSPKREFRGVWLTSVYGIDWPSVSGTSAEIVKAQQDELDVYLDRFKELRLTTVCFQVRSLADALYHSNREPWASVTTGRRGVDPGWDPLEYVIEGCHRRGLECYAWINPFRWSAGTDYNTELDRRFKEQGLLLTYDKYTVFNPALPQVRAHIIEVCREIIANYNLDGILFDDYFYPNRIPENGTAADATLFSRSGEEKIGQWRRDNINYMVTEIYDLIQQMRPEMRFGIGPAGVAGKAETSARKYGVEPCPVTAADWQWNEIYSDPLAWLADGTIDFISPQLYWPTTHSKAPYQPLTQWWSNIAAAFGRHYYASHSLSFVIDNDTPQSWEEVARQIELNRQYAIPGSSPGSCFFSAKPLLGNVGNHLRDNVFDTPALPPAVTWKATPRYDAVSGLRATRDVVTWQPMAPARPGSIVRYSVYLLPPGVKADGDIPGEYFQGLSYSPSFALNERPGRGWKVAVAVVDGYGIEHTPAILNL